MCIRDSVSDPVHYVVELTVDPGDDELSEAEEEVIEATFKKFGRYNQFDLAAHLHQMLEEWQAVEHGRIPITYRDILKAIKKSPEEIAAIEEELSALSEVEMCIRDSLQDGARRILQVESQMILGDGNVRAGSQADQVVGVRQPPGLVEIVDAPDQAAFGIAPRPEILDVQIAHAEHYRGGRQIAADFRPDLRPAIVGLSLIHI